MLSFLLLHLQRFLISAANLSLSCCSCAVRVMAEQLDVPAATERAQMQDWTNMALFLGSAEWDLLMGAQRQLVKVDGLAKYLVRLGLRHPSEKTMATIAALVAAASGEDIDNNAARQVALLATVKSVVRTCIVRASQLGTPIHGGILQSLPVSVDLLPQELRNVFFGQGAAEPRVDVNGVLRSARAWPMRSTHRTRQVSTGNVLQGPSALMGGQGCSGVEIAQQAAVAAAQSMLALVVGPSAPSLPGLQIFARPGQGQAVSRSSSQGALESLMERAQQEPAMVPRPLALADGSAGAATADSQESQERNVTTTFLASAFEPLQSAETAPSAGQGPSVQIPAESSLQEDKTGVNSQRPREPLSSGAAGVQESLAALALAHYEQEAPVVVEQQSLGKENSEGCALKKPASKKIPAKKSAIQKTGLKKPAAAAAPKSRVKSGQICDKPAVVAARGMKRPAAAAAAQRTITQKEARKQRPSGCSKCRWTRVGCCRSCWAGRGFTLLDD